MRRLSSPSLSQVGNYRISRQIASGSFGKVYLARHKFIDCSVCLKQGARDPADLQQGGNIMREFYCLRQFGDHPNVTKIYEVILTERSVYLVLQYYPGGDLLELLRGAGTPGSRANPACATGTGCPGLPVPLCLRLFTQLTGAVYYLHRSGCCHRDLKLENVLLDSAGNVRLSDFGFTRELPLPRGAGGRRPLQEFCGTEAYMAPELIRREPYQGIKTDTWALGVILYTLLTGRMPFDDRLPSVELRSSIEADVVDFSLSPFTGANMSAQAKPLVSLVSALLSKSPDDRPQLDDVLNSPLLQPYGGPHQIQLAATLVARHAAHDDPLHALSSSDRAAFRRLVKAGIDRRELAHAIRHDTLDSLDGLWKLLLDHKGKHKHRKRRPVSGTSFLGLHTGGKNSPRPRASPTPRTVSRKKCGAGYPTGRTVSSPVSPTRHKLHVTASAPVHHSHGKLQRIFGHHGTFWRRFSAEKLPVKDSTRPRAATVNQESAPIPPASPAADRKSLTSSPPASPSAVHALPSPHRPAKWHSSVRPASVVSSFSVLSETSANSSSFTGYSTDNRPAPSRNVSSANSSITGISRTASIDSSSRSSTGMMSPGLHHKQVVNTKWNFGIPGGNTSLKRFRKHAPKGIIEEEESSVEENQLERVDEQDSAQVSESIGGAQSKSGNNSVNSRSSVDGNSIVSNHSTNSVNSDNSVSSVDANHSINSIPHSHNSSHSVHSIGSEADHSLHSVASSHSINSVVPTTPVRSLHSSVSVVPDGNDGDDEGDDEADAEADDEADLSVPAESTRIDK